MLSELFMGVGGWEYSSTHLHFIGWGPANFMGQRLIKDKQKFTAHASLKYRASVPGDSEGHLELLTKEQQMCGEVAGHRRRTLSLQGKLWEGKYNPGKLVGDKPGEQVLLASASDWRLPWVLAIYLHKG